MAQRHLLGDDSARIAGMILCLKFINALFATIRGSCGVYEVRVIRNRFAKS